MTPRCFRCGEDTMIRATSENSYTCDECGNAWTFGTRTTRPALSPRTFDGKPACIKCGNEPALTTKKGRPNCGGLGANCYYTPTQEA